MPGLGCLVNCGCCKPQGRSCPRCLQAVGSSTLTCKWGVRVLPGVFLCTLISDAVCVPVCCSPPCSFLQVRPRGSAGWESSLRQKPPVRLIFQAGQTHHEMQIKESSSVEALRELPAPLRVRAVGPGAVCGAGGWPECCMPHASVSLCGVCAFQLGALTAFDCEVEGGKQEMPLLPCALRTKQCSLSCTQPWTL